MGIEGQSSLGCDVIVPEDYPTRGHGSMGAVQYLVTWAGITQTLTDSAAG